MKRKYFFSTPNDSLMLLRCFEEYFPVKYIRYGQSTTPNPPIYLNGKDIPSLGVSSESTGSSSLSYLLTIQDRLNNIEKFTDSTGSTRWIVDNGNNEDSVVLTMAGLWGDVVLPGNISTLHNSSEAQQIMRKFSTALRKLKFIKIDMWWVSPEALEMLRNGKRLATAAYEFSPAYDLPLPEDVQTK